MHTEIENILDNALSEIQDIINEDFDSELAPHIVKTMGNQDQCAIDESYNNHTDALCKEGVIPDFIYDQLTHDDYSDSEWLEISNKALKL